MATTWIKPLHKNGDVSAALGKSLDYISDKSKSNEGEFVEGYMCNPQTAQNEFLLSKQLYAKNTGRDQGKHDVIAYHIRMSFKPGEVSAEKALELGRDLAMRWTRGKHQFVIAAHVNTQSPHVHIIYNSVNLDCDRKYKDFLYSYKPLRRLSDLICLEHGLTVIENPALSKGYNREEYLHARANGNADVSGKPPSVRDQLRDYIDTALAIATHDHCAMENDKITTTISGDDTKSTFDGFIAAMKNAGCEVKRGKHLAFKIPGGQRFIRCKSLGEDYEEAALLERVSGIRIVEPENEKALSQTETEEELSVHHTSTAPIPTQRPTPPHKSSSMLKVVPSSPTHNKPNLLIDIQAKLQLAHSPGFEYFAKRYNLKEMAKTLLFLQDHNLEHLDTLTNKVEDVTHSFNNRCTRIKAIEVRQKEISELQKHIGAYTKTKDIFAEYQRLKRENPSTLSKLAKAKSLAQKFYDENESAINRCRDSKKYFDAHDFTNAPGKKLPTIKTLQTEYATLEAERKKLWSGHKAEREEMVELKMALQNVRLFFAEPYEQKIVRTNGTR